MAFPLNVHFIFVFFLVVVSIGIETVVFESNPPRPLTCSIWVVEDGAGLRVGRLVGLGVDGALLRGARGVVGRGVAGVGRGVGAGLGSLVVAACGSGWRVLIEDGVNTLPPGCLVGAGWAGWAADGTTPTVCTPAPPN